jgi:hypothetical protein
MNATAPLIPESAATGEPRGLSIDDVLAAWESFALDAPYRSSTRILYRRIATRFLRWLEPQGIGLAQVMPEVVERFLDAPSLSVPSKPTYRTALRFFFNAVVRQGLLAENPALAARLGRAREVNQEAITAPARRPPTREELKGYVRELALDPMEDDDEDFNAALVLLAGLHLGTGKILPLSRLTGVRPRHVAEFAARLRANDVWTSCGKTSGQWEDGQLAFWLDVWIATGLLERAPGADCPPQNSAAESSQP